MTKMKTRKTLLMVLSLVLVAVVSVAGTLAYLTRSTDPVVNTFTVGNIKIDLEEHPLKEGSTSEIDTTADTVKAVDGYKLVPGADLQKDPFVTVEANSENCWVFVKVEEINNYVGEVPYVTYAIGEGWTELTSAADTTNHVRVFYRTTNYVLNAEEVTYHVFANDKVTANNFTKEMADLITENNQPQLKLTAYAIQESADFNDAAGAWAKVSG